MLKGYKQVIDTNGNKLRTVSPYAAKRLLALGVANAIGGTNLIQMSVFTDITPSDLDKMDDFSLPGEQPFGTPFVATTDSGDYRLPWDASKDDANEPGISGSVLDISESEAIAFNNIDIRTIRIGDALKRHGLINDIQIADAVEYQTVNPGKRFGECLIELGYIKEEIILNFLSELLNIRIVNLKTEPIDETVVGLLPKQIAELYGILVIAKDEFDVTLAVNDPLNFRAIEEARSFVHLNVIVVLAKKEDIKERIMYLYSEHAARSVAAEIADTTTVVTGKEEILNFDAADSEDDVPVVRLVNSILSKGFSVEATDIHIEPYERDVVIRMRADGTIWEYMTIDNSIHSALVARLKIISNLDIAEKRLPQDGNFKGQLGSNSINVRVSVLPTVYGEKIVLRFLDMKTGITNEGSFGMTQANYEKALRILENPHGCVYISGATGSGKTTTLYSFLEHLRKLPVCIVSVEDPVERKIKKISQVQVNPVAGLTFAAALRSILRQDPDIIMIGETRDEETAQIAVRSAITGHLVLSTIHTNSAISIISRLSDMGTKTYLLADALAGLIAQRLVRKLCEKCKVEVELQAQEKVMLRDPEINTAYNAAGCKECNETGYKGRVAVHEIIEIDSKLREMITNKAPLAEIKEHCIKVQNTQFLDDGIIELIKNGMTTIAELVRVAYLES
ncbi:MAG: GspE/PulE family protein [Defluviitaleaceae bacterium]|nr:GspE/PulE family protein [Defluviitaleaceae bacterium]